MIASSIWRAAVCVAVIAICVRVNAQMSPVITLPSGQQLQGLVSPLAYQYLGIPFAAPPIGSLRWRAAEPAAPWSGVLSATQWGPACPQTCELPPHTCPDTTSEDCLSLNVYAPLAPPDAPWPVMFFIHGGNFKQGFGGGPLYDSSTIANSTNTIYVTVNYRIGALSTMLGTDVTTGEVVPGNLAITDQRLALQWVHDNIAAFGGDPKRLTIFGQSAGAVSVAIHALAPLSAGLFSSAIMQSCPFGVPLRSTSDALVYASGVAYFLNCTKSDFACLRSKSVEQIIAAQSKAQKDPLVDPSLLEIFMPTTPHYGPGSEIPANVYASFQSGSAPLNVPVVIGVTHDEAVPFIYGAFGKPLGKLEFELLLYAIFGSHAVAPLLDFYPAPANTTDYRDLMTVIGTHAIFACSSRNASQAAAAGGATIYSYVYDHVASFSANMWGKNFSFCFDKVCHAAELPFVFSPPDLDVFGDGMTSTEQSLATLMSQHWSSMAANAAPAPSWPQYAQQSSLQQMYFATPPVVVSDWLESTCNFWDQTIGWKWV